MSEIFKLIEVYSGIVSIQRKSIETLQEANAQNEEMIAGYKLVVQHFIRQIGILIEALDTDVKVDADKLATVKEDFEAIKGLLNEIWEQ